MRSRLLKTSKEVVERMKKHSPYDLSFYRQPGPKHLESLIIQITKDIGAKRVLDVGAGSGWLVKALRNNGLKTIGYDNSPLAVKKDLVIQGQATQLPFPPNSFDLVTAISLIEHLTRSEAKRFLTEVKRVLRPKGYLFLITPNYASPLRLIQGKKWHGFLDPTHVTFYTPWSLRNLLKRNGFKNTKFTFPPPDIEGFDWTVPKPIKNSPKPMKIILNFLATSTILALLKNSFSILAQSTKNRWRNQK